MVKNHVNNITSTKKGGEDEDIAEDKTDHFRTVPGWSNDPARQGYLPQGIQYKEYVVPNYGIRGPGPQRIVVGADGSWYYTPDHYDTFIRFKP